MLPLFACWTPQESRRAQRREMWIEQGQGKATIIPCRGVLLVVVERTPHPGSSDFVRQHARRPWLTGPQPEEVRRRVVTAEEAIRLLFREGLHLSLAEQDALTHLERLMPPCLPGREATFFQESRPRPL